MDLKKALQEMQITSLTTMQKEVSELIQDKKDVVLISPTGSGKTLAYILPFLENIQLQEKKKHFPKALILVPTRELALQVADVIRCILKYTEGIRTSVLTGGVDINRQIQIFRNGSDIVVATPQRLLDHIRRHTFKSDVLEYVVIDEADEMLKMGFIEDVDTILNSLENHQTILCTATPSSTLLKYLIDPTIKQYQEAEKLSQHTQITLLTIQEKDKLDALKLALNSKEKTIVFTNTRKTCAFVSEHINNSQALYSGIDAKVRRNIMQDFRSGKCQVLVATDVAGRGIDIPSVKQVILYDYPDQDENLIHRLGRTSRKMVVGKALIMVTSKDFNRSQNIANLLQQKIRKLQYKRSQR